MNKAVMELEIEQSFDGFIYIDKSKLPDLIAALQSFLPKETE